MGVRRAREAPDTEDRRTPAAEPESAEPSRPPAGRPPRPRPPTGDPAEAVRGGRHNIIPEQTPRPAPSAPNGPATEQVPLPTVRRLDEVRSDVSLLQTLMGISFGGTVGYSASVLIPDLSAQPTELTLIAVLSLVSVLFASLWLRVATRLRTLRKRLLPKH